MDPLNALLSRTSIRHFRTDPVPTEVIGQLLECAVRAPNHKLTQPWRFVVLTQGARDRFAEIRAQHRLKRFADPSSAEAQSAAEKVRREAREVPVYILVASVMNPDPLTREEDYAATMMAVENLIVAAQMVGLGTYLRTGGVMQDPQLLDLARMPPELRIVAVISVGYPAGQPAPKPRKPYTELTQWIDR
jgi:nitroreductase